MPMFKVRLTACAYVSGEIELLAASEADAREQALQRTGDVLWQYDGCMETPGFTPEVKDVEEA